MPSVGGSGYNSLLRSRRLDMSVSRDRFVVQAQSTRPVRSASARGVDHRRLALAASLALAALAPAATVEAAKGKAAAAGGPQVEPRQVTRGSVRFETQGN